MLIWTIIKVAIKSIAANKLRSFLTMLGVIIGVAAVIAMIALGAGTQEKITANVRNMGSNMLTVRPEYRSGGGVSSSTDQKDLTIEDAEAILKDVPSVVKVAPEVSNRYQVKYLSKNSNVQVYGTVNTFFSVRNFVVDHGRAFTDAEVNRAAKVAVIGPKTAADLFQGADPIGQQVKIKGINFQIIGMTKAKGDQGFYNPDDQVVIPLTTAMNQVMGRKNLGSISLTVATGEDMAESIIDIGKVLRKQHRLQMNQPDDFRVQNLQEIADSLQQVSSLFTKLLAGIASVSLLVGGIGIMNIMLVSVTERTREIGIRKALGARNFDLLTQFLLEAVVVSLTGGCVGIIFGAGTIALFNYIMITKFGGEFTAIFQLWPVLLSFGFSFVVGVFFGWYPARKAASLDPIEALRYE